MSFLKTRPKMLQSSPCRVRIPGFFHTETSLVIVSLQALFALTVDSHLLHLCLFFFFSINF